MQQFAAQIALVAAEENSRESEVRTRMIPEMIGQAANAVPMQLIDRAVAESDQGAGTRLHPRDQQTRHPPGGVIVDADVGRLDAGARGDDLNDRQRLGVHASQRIADERVIGNGEDQASPAEARIADMCGDRGWVILVHEGAVQRDRSVERFGDPGKRFRQAREERGLRTDEDHLDPRQTPMRRRQPPRVIEGPSGRDDPFHRLRAHPAAPIQHPLDGGGAYAGSGGDVDVGRLGNAPLRSLLPLPVLSRVARPPPCIRSRWRSGVSSERSPRMI